MQNYYALTDRTIIPANSDLNDYTTVGSYLVPSASADTLANKPWPGNQGAYITVSRYSSELFKGMEAKVFGGSIYYRDYENGTWHDWKTIMTNADIQTEYNVANSNVVFRCEATDGSAIQLATTATQLQLQKRTSATGSWEIVWAK